MDDEDTALEEAMDNLKEAGQRIRATQSLMRSEGMTDSENYRDLIRASLRRSL
jgi:AmiR/NasT family two-component response regulator